MKPWMVSRKDGCFDQGRRDNAWGCPDGLESRLPASGVAAAQKGH